PPAAIVHGVPPGFAPCSVPPSPAYVIAAFEFAKHGFAPLQPSAPFIAWLPKSEMRCVLLATSTKKKLTKSGSASESGLAIVVLRPAPWKPARALSAENTAHCTLSWFGK